MRLWDVHREETASQMEGHEDTVFQVLFDRLGKRVLSASADGTARLWNVESGETIQVFSVDAPGNPERQSLTRVFSAAFSPDEQKLLTAQSDGEVRLWDVASGKPIRSFGPDDSATKPVEGHAPTHYVWFVTFSPDGSKAFSASFAGTVIQWNVSTGEVVRRYTEHQDAVLGITLLREGTRFLSYSWDRSIILWDAGSGAVLHRYAGHEDWIWSVALSPDEKSFLSASADHTMILWDLETPREIRRYVGHDDAVLGVDFSNDGHLAVSAGRDNLITLWDVESGEWLRQFRGHTDWVRSVDYSPVANRIVTAGEDRIIRIWDVPTLHEVVPWARRNRNVRELTSEERVAYRLTSRRD